MATADKTVRTARAREGLATRHAEMREVLDHWAGVLGATADGGIPVRPVRSLLRAFLVDEVLPHARAETEPPAAVSRNRARGRAASSLMPSGDLLASSSSDRI